jgi:hypothetical protein
MELTGVVTRGNKGNGVELLGGSAHPVLLLKPVVQEYVNARHWEGKHQPEGMRELGKIKGT